MHHVTYQTKGGRRFSGIGLAATAQKLGLPRVNSRWQFLPDTPAWAHIDVVVVEDGRGRREFIAHAPWSEPRA
jgi:hypothetical protein